MARDAKFAGDEGVYGAGRDGARLHVDHAGPWRRRALFTEQAFTFVQDRCRRLHGYRCRRSVAVSVSRRG